MKLSPQTKSSLIQSMAINTVICIVFLGMFFILVFPKISEIESHKTDFQELYTYSQDLKKQWIDYDAYLSFMQQNTQDVYEKKLVSVLEKDFFHEHFSNTGSGSYEEFLDGVSRSVQETKNSYEYTQKNTTLNKILPYYSVSSQREKTQLSNFDFTNYIEQILYSFNLNFDGEIGVGNIENIDREGFQNSSSLSENIFQIPLKFSLSGRKTDIIDFLHYFENVWSINVLWEDLVLHEDAFLNRKKIWENSENVYKGHFWEITSLWMLKYPDSSSVSQNLPLVSVLKRSQASERMSIDVSLIFYVSGIPGYQMEELILKSLTDFEKLRKDIKIAHNTYQKNLSQYTNGEQLRAVWKLASLESLIEALEGDMKALRKNFVKKEDIESTFDTAFDLQGVLDRQRTALEEIQLLLQ